MGCSRSGDDSANLGQRKGYGARQSGGRARPTGCQSEGVNFKIGWEQPGNRTDQH
jgi:hypothetical protein